MSNITTLSDAELDAVNGGGLRIRIGDINIASGNTAISGAVIGDVKKAGVSVWVVGTGDANAGNVVINL